MAKEPERKRGGKGKPWPPLPTAGQQPEPKSRRQVVEEVVEEPERTREEEETWEVIDALPRDGKLRLERWNGDEKGWALIGTFTPDTWDVDKITERYGGGKFRVQAHAPNESGKMVYVGRRVFLVDSAVGLKPQSAAEPGGVKGLLESGIVNLIQMQTQMLQAVMERRESTSDLVTAIATLMKPTTEPRREESAIDAASKLLGLVKEIAGGKSGEGGISEIIDAIKSIKGVAEDLVPDSGGDGGALTRIADALLTRLDRAIETEKKTPAAPGQTLLSGAPEWLRPFLGFLPMLIRAAERAADPELYADLLYDQISSHDPQGHLTVLVADASYPDVVLSALPATTATYHPWLRRVLDHLKAIVVEEETVDDGEALPDSVEGQGHSGDDSEDEEPSQ